MNKLLGMSVMAVCVSFAACAASDDSSGAGGSAGGGSGGAGAKEGGVGGSTTGGSGGSTSGGSGGSTSGGSGGSTTDGGGGSDSGTGGAVGDAGTSTLIGLVVQLLDQTQPNVGMQVCVQDFPSIPCATTDSTGTYTLNGVPANTEVLLKFTKSGYFPALYTVLTAPGFMNVGEFPAPTTSEANLFGASVGITIDATKGQILFLAVTGTPGSFTGQDGASGTLSPKSGTGPYYTNAQSVPDTSLTATSTNGAGLFANVNPGDVEIDMTHSSKTCARYAASWPGSKPTAAKVRVVAGHVTGGALLQCP